MGREVFDRSQSQVAGVRRSKWCGGRGALIDHILDHFWQNRSRAGYCGLVISAEAQIALSAFDLLESPNSDIT